MKFSFITEEIFGIKYINPYIEEHPKHI